jgi:hypothetical protein
MTRNPAEIDPADFPCRALFVGTDPMADTCIAWFDDPNVSDALAEQIDAAFCRGGHCLILARDEDTLERVQSAIALIASPYNTTPPREAELVQ